jgi:hypothetical protein
MFQYQRLSSSPSTYGLRKNLLSNVVQACHLIGLVLKPLLPHDKVGLPLLFVLILPSALLPKFHHVLLDRLELD